MAAGNMQEIARTIKWQAHQSSNMEMPENTLAAMRHAWELGGIPELDIRQTADGVIVGMHDATPRRTIDAPDSELDTPISQCSYERVKRWDAGIRFSERFRGERVPSLAEALEILAQHPEREIYLDYKEVDLQRLAALIRDYGVERQVIFAHNDYENCKTLKRLAPAVRTMLWISGGGTPEGIAQRFAEADDAGFAGLDMVQIHLRDLPAPARWRYQVEPDFLHQALSRTSAAGVELEVLIFHFDPQSLYALLDMGIRRFAVDEPKRFVETLRHY